MDMYNTNLNKEDLMAIDRFLISNWYTIKKLYPDINLDTPPNPGSEDAGAIIGVLEHNAMVNLGKDRLTRQLDPSKFSALPLNQRLNIIEKRLAMDLAAYELKDFLNRRKL